MYFFNSCVIVMQCKRALKVEQYLLFFAFLFKNLLTENVWLEMVKKEETPTSNTTPDAYLS